MQIGDLCERVWYSLLMAEGTLTNVAGRMIVCDGLRAVWRRPSFGHVLESDWRVSALLSRLNEGDVLLCLRVVPSGVPAYGDAIEVLCKNGIGYVSDSVF